MIVRAALCLTAMLVLFPDLVCAQAAKPKEGEGPPALKIGINPWPACQFWALAKKKGLTDKAAVKIEIVSFPSWKESIKAFSEGKLDGVHEALCTTLVQTAQGGQPRKIITATDQSLADGLVAQPKIKTLAELKGKTVGVELDTESYYLLLWILDTAKIPKEDIKFEDISAEPGVKALAEKKLDALMTWEPYLTQVSKKISGNILYKANRGQAFIVDVLSFSDKAITERKDDVLNALKLYLDAMGEWEISRAPCNEIMAKAQGVGTSDFTKAMSTLVPMSYFRAVRYMQSGELETTLRTWESFLRRAKILAKPVNARSLLDGSFMDLIAEQKLQ